MNCTLRTYIDCNPVELAGTITLSAVSIFIGVLILAIFLELLGRRP